MSFSIFISYSTKNLDWVNKLRVALESLDVDVFIAETSIRGGERLEAKITTAIQTCDQVVVLWSEHAKGSEWVAPEIAAAKALAKPVIPFVLDAECVLPPFIRDLKYISICHGVEKAMEQLKEAVASAQAKKSRQEVGALTMIVGFLLMAA
jgi:hypothetical protein